MKKHGEVLCALFTIALAACSASSSPAGSAVGDENGGSGGSSGSAPIGGSGGTIPAGGSGGSSPCTETTGTSLSGFVYDPAGKVPLYNVVVYVPVAGTELPPITDALRARRARDAKRAPSPSPSPTPRGISC